MSNLSTGDARVRPSVLVVDDEQDVADAYALWLRDDYDVETATSGADALERVDEETDVVLLDRRMPKLSGDEVLAEIRDESYDVRVAMVTAVDPDFDITSMAFDSYVTKPVTRDALKETVEELLTLSEYDDAVREQFAIASKEAALEAQKSEEELAASETYQRLQQRFEELSRQTGQTVEDFDHETFLTAIQDVDEDSTSAS